MLGMGCTLLGPTAQLAAPTASVEGWLQSLFQCRHLTVWIFVTVIQRDV